MGKKGLSGRRDGTIQSTIDRGRLCHWEKTRQPTCQGDKGRLQTLMMAAIREVMATCRPCVSWELVPTFARVRYGNVHSFTVHTPQTLVSFKEGREQKKPEDATQTARHFDVLGDSC